MSFLSIGKTKFFDFKNFYAARVTELESYYLKARNLKGRCWRDIVLMSALEGPDADVLKYINI